MHNRYKQNPIFALIVAINCPGFRITQRGSYVSEALMSALKALQQGQSLKKTVREYGIPAKTLRRHRDGKVSTPGTSVLGRISTVFGGEFESLLVNHITEMERALFGLTTTDMRRLAFDLAEKLKLKHPFSHANKMAGVEWLRSFLKRHGEITIRNPEATSLSRAVGFNQAKVNQFFTVYGEVLDKGSYSARQIWNMDESGITNVHKPTKILASKGRSQVGKICSGERGHTVTVVCAMSAAGNYLPPFMIFPRKRMIDVLMKGSPPGSVGVASPNGWTNGELFIDWLTHFVHEVKCSKSDPCILILDDHQSHKTLQAIDMARDNGITMITLPPHSTHKMQPLDRSFFKSLKSAYNATCDGWMRSNAGRRISFFDMAEPFGKVYVKTADMAKAVNGFSTCGIWPFNSAIFSEEDFLAAKLTDEPQPVNSVTDSQPGTSTQLRPHLNDGGAGGVPTAAGPISIEMESPDSAATPTTADEVAEDVHCSSLADRSSVTGEKIISHPRTPTSVEMNTSSSAAPPAASEEVVTGHSSALVDLNSSGLADSSNSAAAAEATDKVASSQPGTSVEISSFNSAAAVEMMRSLSPRPKTSAQRSRKRKTESAMNITSSPYKKSLMEKTSPHTAVGIRKKTKSKQKIEKKGPTRKTAVKNVKTKPKKKVTRDTSP